MNSNIINLIGILNNNKDLIKEAFVHMVQHKRECPTNQIENRSKILFATLIAILYQIKQGKYDDKMYNDILFYRKIFYHIFSNIPFIREKKSIIKKVYMELNSIKKEYDKIMAKNLCRSLSEGPETESESENEISHTPVYSKLGTPSSSIISTMGKASTITTPISYSNVSDLTSNILAKSIHSYELNPKINDSEEICLDDPIKLEHSYKVIGLLKILLVFLEKDISHLQVQLNLKEPNEQSSNIDIDFINRLLYIFFSQYLTIVTKHCNLFVNKDSVKTYKIKFGETFLTVCTLDNIDIKEDKIDDCKTIVLTVGKNISYLSYIQSDITNDRFQNILIKNLDNLSTVMSIINTNYKILESCLLKIGKICVNDTNK